MQSAGSSVANLMQLGVYVTDIEQWPAFNRIYQQRPGAAPPARAVVPVPLLHHGFLIEAEAAGVIGLLEKKYLLALIGPSADCAKRLSRTHKTSRNARGI